MVVRTLSDNQTCTTLNRTASLRTTLLCVLASPLSVPATMEIDQSDTVKTATISATRLRKASCISITVVSRISGTVTWRSRDTWLMASSGQLKKLVLMLWIFSEVIPLIKLFCVFYAYPYSVCIALSSNLIHFKVCC